MYVFTEHREIALRVHQEVLLWLTRRIIVAFMEPVDL